MKRLFARGAALVMAMGIATASLGPGVASASHGPGECTFKSGQTTCVETTTVTTTRTETAPATRPCEVGRSGRTGTQEGTETRTFEVTTTTTTTRVFAGRSENLRSENTETETTEELIDVDFTPTGPCRNVPGPQS